MEQPLVPESNEVRAHAAELAAIESSRREIRRARTLARAQRFERAARRFLTGAVVMAGAMVCGSVAARVLFGPGTPGAYVTVTVFIVVAAWVTVFVLED